MILAVIKITPYLMTRLVVEMADGKPVKLFHAA